MVNMDRTTGKVAVSRRTKQAYSESKWTQGHITVNACVFLQVAKYYQHA